MCTNLMYGGPLDRKSLDLPDNLWTFYAETLDPWPPVNFIKNVGTNEGDVEVTRIHHEYLRHRFHIYYDLVESYTMDIFVESNVNLDLVQAEIEAVATLSGIFCQTML